MGGETFYTIDNGKNAQEAFNNAVNQALYDYGHAGYTGTIAEKNSFVVIDVPEGMEPRDYAHHLIDKSDPRIDDKWGDAGCFDLGNGEYFFFGWASC
jgi:hypothetical protein